MDGGTNAGYCNNLNSVIYADNQFVAVGENGTILTSPDGAGWTIKTTSTNSNLTVVNYINSQFIIMGDSINTVYNYNPITTAHSIILLSASGATWTMQSSAMNFIAASVAYGNNQFVGVGDTICYWRMRWVIYHSFFSCAPNLHKQSLLGKRFWSTFSQFC